MKQANKPKVLQSLLQQLTAAWITDHKSAMPAIMQISLF